MNDELHRRIEFLRQANVGAMKHSRNGLLAHLLGTRKLLEEWGARPALCDVGLFHSVYGTDAYPDEAIPFAMRGRVEEVIGKEAENIVWLTVPSFGAENTVTVRTDLDMDSFSRFFGG